MIYMPYFTKKEKFAPKSFAKTILDSCYLVHFLPFPPLTSLWSQGSPRFSRRAHLSLVAGLTSL